MLNRVIIPCGGQGSRWQDYMGVPKQLIKYNDRDAVLSRTLALCQRPDVEDVYVPTDDPRINKVIKPPVRPVGVTPHPYPAPIDKFLSSENLWSDEHPTVVLFGDVYFTQEAIDTIMQDENDNLVFYGRIGASEVTGKRGGEIFATKIRPKDRQQMKAHCEFLRWSVYTGRLRDIWALAKIVLASMATMAGEHKDCYQYTEDLEKSKYFKTVDDMTEDFDKPKDFILWKQNATKFGII